ncbi:hypothetical protein GCM10009801_30790 [Streptomyces albiaxialis]|uniref:Immunity protein 35 domain-containing protein n=1 Tax=Streptomyces albiaxialis TaxID=329523 RepID=A0ABN2VX21_9ACTN
MLNKQEALFRANDFLREKSKEWNKEGEIRIESEGAFTDKDSLLVCYNTIAYLDHGDELDRLAGNNPIEVNLRTGDCRILSLDETLKYMDEGFLK